jgi:hypothetical protein
MAKFTYGSTIALDYVALDIKLQPGSNVHSDLIIHHGTVNYVHIVVGVR